MTDLDKYFEEADKADDSNLPTVDDVVKESAEYNQSMTNLYNSIFGGSK